MRMLIKKLLKKHRYPPEGMEDAVQIVMTQCELWTDSVMDVEDDKEYDFRREQPLSMVAEGSNYYSNNNM